ncbi:hypothetical protein RUM44_013816 [Polyplax serrata]|uniref:Phosphoinositide phospholipase C n=1 Tax=Polyplax serrata TaxID=468196 RepID=A0ABR1BF78_POLSC
MGIRWYYVFFIGSETGNKRLCDSKRSRNDGRLKCAKDKCPPCGSSSKRKFLTAEKFVDFLNKTQRDPRLNEILYPYANPARAKDLIQQYETNKYNAQKGQLSLDGFLRYLMSDDNPIMASSSFDLSDDMDQPLSHYFINSSHNTYLTGHQITGKSSVEIYRQCLLAGCRCVELDFWNGRIDEPVIVHGYTFVPEINAKEVIEAIAESAFKTSDFPVILSFENHCNPRQQAKIAQYCREIFGDMLLDVPLDSHPLEPGSFLPSPAVLRHKIIIKNKKKHHHHHKKNHGGFRSTGMDNMATEVTGNGDIPHAPPLQTRQGSKDSQNEDDENDDEDESSSAEEDDDVVEELKLRGGSSEKTTDKAATAKETEAGAEISALVNYIQPVHFTSFEVAEKKNRFYEMSSFDEKQATTLLKERPIEFVNYNKLQLSRVYPSGKRFDSSNFMPQVFWNAGCQLVALNYQTLDLAMQLNLGIFEYNARCGFLLKPEFMRRKDRRLDPFAESTVDGIIAGTVSIQVISGQFLSDKRVGTYIEVDMYGLPADTVRRKFRTRIVPNNAINPQYNEEPFVFKKVVLPELASLRISAYEESGRFIGHRVLPVTGLCPGYRHVSLRTEAGQPLPLATLFLLVVVKDYVPDGLSDFAEALANPIKYQSDLEKRAQQLSVLTDECEVESANDQEESTTNSSSTAPMVKPPPKRHQSSCPDLGTTPPLPTVAAAPTSHRASVVVSMTEQTDSISRLESDSSSTADTSMHSSPSMNKSSASSVTSHISSSLNDVLVADSIEKLMENKVVKEKRQELEKKVEVLRKKHEKERQRLTSLDGDKSKTKFYTNKLVKRLSSKNIDLGFSTHEPPDYAESDDSTKGTLTRTHSERLITICKDYLTQEKELREKYNEVIFTIVEKLMKNSQSNQLKTLKVLLEKETESVMRELQTTRRDEVKKLSKIHKDKDEMVRIKREVDSAMIDKGVHERVRLSQLYDRKRDDLERQHEHVRQSLEEERIKCRASLLKDYESKVARVEEEFLSPSSSQAGVQL